MNIIYATIHIFALIGMCISITWLAFRAKKEKVKYAFMMCQTLIIIWSVSKITDLLAADDFQLYLCYVFGNIGVCFIGSAWVHFSLLYRAQKKRQTAVNILYTVSALNYIAVVTNPLHKFYYTSLSIERVDHGVLFYENVAFTYICILTGIINVYRKSFVEKKASKRQATFVALSVIIPTVLNVIFITGKLPERFDPTPFGFALTSVMILMAVYKYDFLDVNYMTFPKIFKNVPGGIIVTDRFDEITYINETAEELLNECEGIENFLRTVKNAESEDSRNRLFSETEISFYNRRLSVRRYNQLDSGVLIASAFILIDVSRYYELIEKNRKLNEANEEIAVEKERNRLAQEVHDTAGHTLTMISSAAKILKIKYPDLPEEAAQYIDSIALEATAGITTLRMAVNNIKRHSYTSITDGIKELAESVKGIECDVCVQGEETEKYLFCAAAVCNSCREAITNSLRYSGADRIDIVTKFLDNSLEVYVFDNGCGCSEINEGNGLTGTVRRIREIGGEVSFMSSEGNGFTTAIKIPMEERI